MRLNDEKRMLWRRLTVLAAASFLAWLPSLWNGFVWLDHFQIVEGGYRVLNSGDFKKVWSWSREAYEERNELPGKPEPQGSYFRPLYALGSSASYFLWRDYAWGWHLESVAWHTLNITLLYLFGMRVGSRKLPGGWQKAVFWATLLFAVHPLGEQSVAWISGRNDSMCVAFSLAAIHSYLQVGEGRSKGIRTMWAVACALAFLIAAGCKELAIIVPALLTAGTIVRVIQLRRRRMQLVVLLLIWLLAIGFVIYRASVLGSFGLGARPPLTTIPGRVAMGGTLILDYLSRIALPRQGLLSDAWPLDPGGAATFLAAGGSVLVLLGLGILFWRWPTIRLPLLWFGIWLFPTSTVVPLWHFRAERYLYPASWGILLAIVLVLYHVFEGKDKKSCDGSAWLGKVFMAVAVVTLLITWSTLPRWKSDAALAEDAVERDPHHAEAHMLLGEIALHAKNFPAAERHLNSALAAANDKTHVSYLARAIAWSNRGICRYQQKKFDAALADFDRAMAFHPRNLEVRYKSGLTAMAMGKLDLAEKHFREVLARKPSDIRSRDKLALTLMRLGDLEGCVETYQPLIDTGWDDLNGLHTYGSALLVLKRFPMAAEVFEQILAKKPGEGLFLAKLAWCLYELGDQEQAREKMEEAMKADPENPDIKNIIQFIREK